MWAEFFLRTDNRLDAGDRGSPLRKRLRAFPHHDMRSQEVSARIRGPSQDSLQRFDTAVEYHGSSARHELLFIGVDLGGTNLRIAAVTQHGEALGTIHLPTRLAGRAPGGVSTIWRPRFANSWISIRQPAGHWGWQPRPAGVAAGNAASSSESPGFDGSNLRLELERRTDRPVQVDSDANLAAYGEFLLGAGRSYGVNSLLMSTLGTGVGCGIVLEGRIWRGMKGAAGESGHGPIFPDGIPCPCGARGCLEMYASATAIVRRAVELGIEPPPSTDRPDLRRRRSLSSPRPVTSARCGSSTRSVRRSDFRSRIWSTRWICHSM